MTERWLRSRLRDSGARMANDRATSIHLGPDATTALASAFDSALQAFHSGGGEGYPLLRYLLARHLMYAAFAGERHPDHLRERAIAFVAECLRRSTAGDDFDLCEALQASTKSVTRLELGEILLTEAQKALPPCDPIYSGHVNVYAVDGRSDAGPNWTIQAFTPWTSDIEQCRQSLGAAERNLKNEYQVILDAQDR